MILVLAKQFIQEIYLPEEIYESDYAEVTSKLFKSAKLALEYEVSKIREELLDIDTKINITNHFLILNPSQISNIFFAVE